jgi:hypothetical protein
LGKEDKRIYYYRFNGATVTAGKGSRVVGVMPFITITYTPILILCKQYEIRI